MARPDMREVADTLADAVAIRAEDFHPSRRYLFWVEPRARHAAFIDFLKSARLRNFRLFVPGAKPMATLLTQATEAGFPLDGSVLPYSSVHAGIDEPLYTASEVYARWIVSLFLQLQRALPDGRDPSLLARPMEMMLADRLAATLRPALTFAHTVSRMARPPLVFVPKAASDLGLQAAALDPGMLGDAAVFDVEGRYAANPVRALVPRPYNPFEAVYHRHPVFEPAAVRAALAGARVAMVSNLADKQYRFVCEQVLVEIAPLAKVGLLNANPGTGLAEHPDSPLVSLCKSEAATLCSQVPGSVFFPDDALLATVARMVTTLRARPPRIGMPEGIGDPVELVVRAVAQYFIPILDLAMHQHAAFAPALDGIEAVVVSPGRYLAASLMVEMARVRGIPAIEIQGGVIARSKRFFKPSADLILCIDRVSRDIYTSFMGVEPERVEVVGSARIDQSVKPAFSVDVEQARKAIGVAPEPGEPLVVIASQPIGIERARRLLDVTLKGVASAGVGLCVVKMHPNESDLYADAYAAVAARHPGLCLKLARDGEAHLYLRAADVVVTYFSTMGLEAFVLGKGVLCVNPFGETPPFDLCGLGVAAPASSSDDVRRALLHMTGPNGPQYYVADPTLSLLRDGQARRRIADAVIRTMRRRKSVA
jgi:hypothetical protein